VQSASCLEWTAWNGDAVAGTPARHRIAKSDSRIAKCTLNTIISANEKKVPATANSGTPRTEPDACSIGA
jgi:hypothetical protein